MKINNESKNNKFGGHWDDARNYSRLSNYHKSGFQTNRMENKNAMISHKLNEKENSRTYVDSHKVFNSSIRNEKGEPKCFSCNLFGHISKDCPNPCTLCGLKGHSKKYCSKNKKEISLSVIDHESSVTADKYLRKATINNRSVSCLLDTGASSCLLKESLAERLGINMTPCKKDLYSFGNQKCPVLQSLGAAVVDFQIGLLAK
ncbi:uncharacterized protein CEXT_683771 [Caerostris extrusa]|uniref:CCHC-type domain-containing protein n=1 Tax=Caerostris extrusa TaxID=172846 RepID=A0AAV4RAB2_CAEEX|nr:uncharacterized protein CEXT_683771 [Caerostris extrusa]